MKYVLIFGTVLITVLTSLLLDYTSQFHSRIDIIAVAVMGLVLGINFLKFLIWGWIHKRYDVSKSYPLTSLFFPIIFVVALINGETEATTQKIVGIVVIVSGLFIFENIRRRAS